MKLFRWIHPLLTVSILLIAFTGEGWGITLSDLQAEAIANRKIVEQYQLGLEQGGLDRKISEGEFWPSVDFFYSANRLDEATPFEPEESSRLTGGVSYNLFSGFKDRYNLKAAKSTEMLREYELQTIIQDLRLEVALFYLNVFRRQENLKVAIEQYELLKKRYEDNLKRHDVGLIRKNDLLKIQVELDNTTQKQRAAKADYQKAVHNLEFVTATPIDPEILNFSDFEKIPEISEFDSYRSQMLANRSEIKALEMVYEARLSQVQMEKARYWPKVDIAAGYSKFGDNYYLTDRVLYDDEFRVGLDVGLNLFEGFQKKNRVKKSELEAEKVDLELAEFKQRLQTSLKNILLDFDVGRENLKVAQTGILQAEENLRITDLSYREGVETATVLLDAILLLSRAKLNLIVARIDLYLNYYRLIRMVDPPFEPGEKSIP